jgi:hypothetical protein
MTEFIEFSGVEKHSEKNVALDLVKLEEMIRFLTALAQNDQRSVNYKNIDLRKDLLEKAKNNELFELVNSSSDIDWQKQPSYYHALIAEIRRRGLITKTNEE